MKIKVVFILIILSFFTSCETLEENDNVLIVNEENENNLENEKKQIDGGQMKIAIMPPKTLNPLLNEDVYVDNMLNLIFQDIYILNDERKPKKNLVEKAIPNYVDNTLTLTLIGDLVWHDGTKITSDDFIYSLQVLQQANEDVIYKNMVNNITAYSKLDEKTVIIQYNDPKHLMGYSLLFPIIPKKYYEKASLNNNLDFKPVGNGYFKFYEQNNSKNYILKRDDEKENMAYIDTVYVEVLRDREIELYAFEKGNIDFVITDIEEWAKYQTTKTPNEYGYTNQVFEFIGFNMSRIIISDKGFREIIAYYIDKDEILNRLYSGKGVTTNSFVDRSSWLYELETVKYSRDFESIQKIINDNYEYDEEQNILYKNINGLKKEVSFTVLVNEENVARVSLAEYIKNDLISFGIKAEIHEVPYNEYIERINSGNYDLVLGGYRFGLDNDVTDFLQNNIFNYSSDILNNRIEAFNDVVDEQSYKVALGELQKLLANELPFISLLYKQNIILTDENLIIPTTPSYSNLFSNVNEWYRVR